MVPRRGELTFGWPSSPRKQFAKLTLHVFVHALSLCLSLFLHLQSQTLTCFGHLQIDINTHVRPQHSRCNLLTSWYDLLDALAMFSICSNICCVWKSLCMVWYVVVSQGVKYQLALRLVTLTRNTNVMLGATRELTVSVAVQNQEEKNRCHHCTYQQGTLLCQLSLVLWLLYCLEWSSPHKVTIQDSGVGVSSDSEAPGDIAVRALSTRWGIAEVKFIGSSACWTLCLRRRSFKRDWHITSMKG